MSKKIQICPCCGAVDKNALYFPAGDDLPFYTCECGALFNNRQNPAPLPVALKLVNFRLFYDGPCENPYYFDFFVTYPDGDVRRVHGWYETVTRRVTQIG